MGRDKAWLEWEGRPLIAHVISRLAPLADELLISTNDPTRYATLVQGLPLPARLVADAYPGAGPLAGLHAGLLAAKHDLVLSAATDMPFVSRELALALLKACAGFDAVLPRLVVAGHDAPQPEPLFAAYRRTCLPPIEAALSAGRRRAVAFLGDINVRFIDEPDLRRVDPDLRSFRNLNTPEEWAEAAGC